MTNEKKEYGNVWEAIEVFLDRKGQNSKNTRRTYELAIRRFFLDTKGKELEQLEVKDLIFTVQEIERYQVGLRDKHKASTVNTKLFAVKSCYEKLRSYGFPVDPNWFSVEKYEEHDKEGSDPMTHAEVVKAISLVMGKRQGKQKALLIRLAYATAFRLESLLELKKCNIINHDGVWAVRVLGKGNKWDTKKLSNDLYEEILSRMNETDSEKLFTLSDKTIKKMMNFIRESIDFGDRKITFHSLKKSSIEEVRIITNNDLKAMQEHGNHASPQTTIKDYSARRKLEDAVIVDINYHVPVEEFDKLSREELLELLHSVDRNVQIKLLQKLGVI